MTTNELVTKARQEVGVVEVPANSNNVKYNTWFYGKNVGGSKYPWCAAFVSYLFRSEQNLCKKTASCADMLEWFEGQNRIVKEPKPGDIVFFHFSTNNRKANHVGIVIRIENDSIITIEGNTSVTSDDNGGRVMQRKRKLKDIIAYARPAYSDAIIPKPKLKSVDEIVKEVIEGKWGSGNSRRQKLTNAGYNYSEIQAKVNEFTKKQEKDNDR